MYTVENGRQTPIGLWVITIATINIHYVHRQAEEKETTHTVYITKVLYTYRAYYLYNFIYMYI